MAQALNTRRVPKCIAADVYFSFFLRCIQTSSLGIDQGGWAFPVCYVMLRSGEQAAGCAAALGVMRVVTAPQNRAIRARNIILGRFEKNTSVLGPLLVLGRYRNEKDAFQRNYFAYVV